MADNKLNLLVRFTGVDKLSGAVRNIMSSSKSGNAAVRALSAEIKDLGKQQKTAESFRKLKSELDQTRRGMDEAAQRATRLGREIAQAEKPTKAMRAEFAKAKREAAALKAKFVEQTAALKSTRSALASAGIDTRRLGDHQRQLAQRIEAANRRLEQQRQRMARVSAIQGRMGKLAASASIAGAAMSAGVTAPGMAVMNGVGNLAAETRAKANAANVGGMDMIQFQRNAQAARSVGIEFDKYGDILKDTQDKIGDFTANGGGEMKDFFDNVGKKVGVTAKSFKNLSGGEALQLYFNSLVKAKVSQKEMVFYMEAIADEGSALIPLLADNGAKMRELGDAAAIITPADAEALQQYTMAQMALETSTTNLQVALAKSGLIDVMTWITDKGTEAAQWFGTLSPEVQRMSVAMGLVAGVAGPVLIGLGMIVSAVSAIVPAIGAIIATVGAVFGAVSLPVLAVVAAIAGAAYLIYSNWQAVSGFFSGIWNAISGAVTRNWTTIRNVMLGGVVIFMPLVAAVAYVASVVYRNWDSISAATMAFVGKVAGIVAPFINPFIQIGTYLAGLAGKFFGFGTNIVQGLINGIVSMAGPVISAIVNLASSIGGKFASMLGIHSPSRLFMAMGGHINDGLSIGLDKGRAQPVSAAARIASAVASAGAVTMAAPIIAQPVLDLTAPTSKAQVFVQPAIDPAAPNLHAPITVRPSLESSDAHLRAPITVRPVLDANVPELRAPLLARPVLDPAAPRSTADIFVQPAIDPTAPMLHAPITVRPWIDPTVPQLRAPIIVNPALASDAPALSVPPTPAVTPDRPTVEMPEFIRAAPAPIQPAASARQPVRQMPPAGDTIVHVNVYQRPGEDAEAFARRVAEIIERKKPRGGGGGSSYQDDF